MYVLCSACLVTKVGVRRLGENTSGLGIKVTATAVLTFRTPLELFKAYQNLLSRASMSGKMNARGCLSVPVLLCMLAGWLAASLAAA